MARNVTISVPDELHEDIQQAKGSIKVSAICQEALSKAVKIAHAIKSEDVLALKEKFQLERKNTLQPYWDEGLKDGQRDAFSLNFSDAINCMSFLKSKDHDEHFAAFEYNASEENKEKYSIIQDGKDKIHGCKGYRRESISMEASYVYFEGWFDGMHSILEKALE